MPEMIFSEFHIEYIKDKKCCHSNIKFLSSLSEIAIKSFCESFYGKNYKLYKKID